MKLPTIWTDEKHSQEEAEAWRKSEGRRQEMEKMRDAESQKREDAGAREGREVAKLCFFPCFVPPGGPKVGSLKWRVRSQLACCGAKHIRKSKCTSN